MFSADSLGSIVDNVSRPEFKAPEGQKRVCSKCRKNPLASTNPGPCHACKRRHGRRLKLEKGKEYAILLPSKT
ncbi:hypothetical protein M0Q28_00360 [Patescibacteria group bacterium]|jgi:hypothetical protein|nr:hypothetical protein [Patescibacteria group bacterium]